VLLNLNTIKTIGVDCKKEKNELLAERFVISTFGAAFILLLRLNASRVTSCVFGTNTKLLQKDRRPHQESHHRPVNN
jgi:hypothetical protein